MVPNPNDLRNKLRPYVLRISGMPCTTARPLQNRQERGHLPLSLQAILEMSFSLQHKMGGKATEGEATTCTEGDRMEDGKNPCLILWKCRDKPWRDIEVYPLM